MGFIEEVAVRVAATAVLKTTGRAALFAIDGAQSLRDKRAEKKAGKKKDKLLSSDRKKSTIWIQFENQSISGLFKKKKITDYSVHDNFGIMCNVRHTLNADLTGLVEILNADGNATLITMKETFQRGFHTTHKYEIGSIDEEYGTAYAEGKLPVRYEAVTGDSWEIVHDPKRSVIYEDGRRIATVDISGLPQKKPYIAVSYSEEDLLDAVFFLPLCMLILAEDTKI